MSFEGLAERAKQAGERRAEAQRNRIIAEARLPEGVAAEAVDGGIMLTGKRLRRQLIDEPRLRNIAR